PQSSIPGSALNYTVCARIHRDLRWWGECSPKYDRTVPAGMHSLRLSAATAALVNTTSWTWTGETSCLILPSYPADVTSGSARRAIRRTRQERAYRNRHNRYWCY